MSSVLAALLARQKSNQENIRGIGDIFERDRLKSLGREFLQRDDYTPDSAQRFIQEKNLGVDEANAFLDVISKFRQAQKDALPVTREREYQDPAGTTHSVIENVENNSYSSPMVTSRAKLQRTETLDDKNNKIIGGYNQYNNTFSPAQSPAGGTVKTGFSPEEKLQQEMSKKRGMMPLNVEESRQKRQATSDINTAGAMEKKRKAVDLFIELTGKYPTDEQIERLLNMSERGITFENPFGLGSGSQQESKGKLTIEKAKEYLEKAGNDKDKARELATQDGWEW